MAIASNTRMSLGIAVAAICVGGIHCRCRAPFRPATRSAKAARQITT
jgi:hypothetical protein